MGQKAEFNKTDIIKSTTFKAELLISNFYFSFQLIGMILFFFGISCYQIILKLIKNLSSKFEENENLVRFIKFIILLIFSIVISILIFKLLNDFKERRDNPLKKEITSNLFKIELSDLVVCAYTNESLSYSYTNKTLLEVENETKNLYSDTVEEIYLDFHGKKTNVKSVLLEDKVLFYNRIGYYLFRCFQIKLSIEEPTYQSLFLNTKLAIKFRHENYELYLLPKENFHTSSYRFDEKNDFFSKKVLIRSKVSKEKCLDYKEVYSKCDSRSNCLDQCVHRKSIENNLDISPYFVIDKSNFNENEWSNFLINTIEENINSQSKDECKKLLDKRDCNQVYFETENKNKVFFGPITVFEKLEIKIDLYYDVYSSIETEPSWYKLILDLLNVQGILFDLNVLQLLTVLFFFFKFKFNLKRSKFYLSFIYAFCLTGFVGHLIFIFKLIIDEELIKSQHYKLVDLIEVPEIIFCFKINQNLIEKEIELTGFISGDKLESLTRNDLTKDTVFDNFTFQPYLNYTNSELKIETFYFLDKKCFNLKTGLKLKKTDYDKNVLRIIFNSSFIKKEKDVQFFTKKPGKLHFSKIQVLDYQKWTYAATQESFVIKKEDKFNFIKRFLKNPFSVFFGQNYLNNVDKYLTKLSDDFKRDKNLTTLHLPLDKSNFNLKINDTAFENYYYEKQVQKDETTFKNPNYERQFANNLMQIRSIKYSKRGK